MEDQSEYILENKEETSKGTLVKGIEQVMGSFMRSLIILLFDEFYKEIEHGDEEHRQWLREKTNDFIKRKLYAD